MQPRAEKFLHWLGLVVLATGLALIVLDGTIVGVSLPVIIADLKLNLSTTEWINSIYSVVFAALLIGFGTLGDRVGRKTIFLVGVLVFVAGSIACALSPDGAWLILGRFIQGLGGAMVLPSSLSNVNANFRGPERAIAFGIWGATMAGAAAVGPLLGGWLTTDYTWHWIFWVNVPAGLTVFLAGIFTLKQSKGLQEKGFDWLGLVLSVIGIGLLIFAVIEGANFGWWTPKKKFDLLGISWPTSRPISIIPIIGVLGLIVSIAFLLTQHRRTKASKPVLINTSLFKYRTFSWGNLSVFTVGLGEFIVVLVIPLFLVVVQELTTMKAGYVLASLAVGSLFSGGLAQPLSKHFGPSRVVIFGLATEVVGVLLTMWLIKPGVSSLILSLPLALYGFGLGLAAAQLTSTVLSEVPPQISGSASAVQSTVRQLGAALGAALGGSMLATGAHHFMTKELQAIVGLKEKLITKLVDAATDSVGATITAWRQSGHPIFGPQTSEIIKALEAGFSKGTVTALGVAALFLALGLLAAINLNRHAQKPTSAQAEA